MDRKFLEELGLDKETIDSIMKEHGKSVQAAKPADYDDLKSAKETLEKQVDDLNGSLKDTQDKYEEQKTSLDDLNSKIKGYEINNSKLRIASQAGLPLDLASRLSGETEEEIKADAEKLAAFVSKPSALPLKDTEPPVNDELEPYKNMLENLNFKGEK